MLNFSLIMPSKIRKKYNFYGYLDFLAIGSAEDLPPRIHADSARFRADPANFRQNNFPPENIFGGSSPDPRGTAAEGLPPSQLPFFLAFTKSLASAQSRDFTFLPLTPKP